MYIKATQNKVEPQKLTLYLILGTLLFSGCAPKTDKPSYSYNKYYNTEDVIGIQLPHEQIITKEITYEYPAEIQEQRVIKPFPVVHKDQTVKPQLKQPEPKRPKYIKPIQPHDFNIYKPSTKQDKLEKVEMIAKSLLGTPYHWGGNGPYSYDCSAYVKKVYKDAAGIELPRVSRDQAKVGQYIAKKSNLQRGDMVFFRDKKHRTVRHVGIYLGSGKFIHASSVPDKVTISSIYEPYYSKHFKWGRRLLT